MQMKALIASVTTLGCGVLGGCGSNSPGEVVIEPGITAIREASALACSSDLGNLQLAIEAFTTLNAAPPTAESELVPDWLRAESELYDLVDGQIVPAADSGCPAAPSDAGAAAAAPETASAVVSQLSANCTMRSKTLLIAVQAYHAMNGVGATPTEQVLLDAGLLLTVDDAYDIEAGDRIVAVPGGECDGVELVTDTVPPAVLDETPLPVTLAECYSERRTLEVAMEWYLEKNGAPAPSESVLVSADVLRREFSGYDIVDGLIVPAPDSMCPPA